MTSHPGIGVYRWLLRCYPRSFRAEYGPDMVILFGHQLQDEPAMRVWVRGVADLAITIPARHLEVHMNRPATSLTPMLFGAVSIAAMTVSALAGTNILVLASALTIAIAAGALAVVSARHLRPVAAPQTATAQWWKLLLVGTIALAAMAIGEGATNIDLWMPMVITILFALIAIAAGLVLGLAHLLTGHSRRPV